MALFSLAVFSKDFKESEDKRRNLTLNNAYANIPSYILNDDSWYFNSLSVCNRNLEKLQVGESYQVGYKKDRDNYLIFTKTGDSPLGQEPVSVIIIDKNYEQNNLIKRIPTLPRSPRLEIYEDQTEKQINYEILCNKFIHRFLAWLTDITNPKPILPTHN
jgi:hypothetical protein